MCPRKLESMKKSMAFLSVICCENIWNEEASTTIDDRRRCFFSSITNVCNALQMEG
jgi:hypothetical protein